MRSFAICQQAQVLEEQVSIPCTWGSGGCGLIFLAEGIFRHNTLEDGCDELAKAGSSNGCSGGVLDKVQAKA
jgi:hypothetical protein